MKNCKICDNKTEIGFNINFKLVPICESCAEDIFLQQAEWYVVNSNLNKKSKNDKKAKNK